MTTLRADVGAGLGGAFRLAIGRPEGIAGIGGDDPAVAHSFVAVAICLPVFVILHMLDWRLHGLPHRPLHAAALQGLGFAIGWAGFLLACRPILQAAGKLRHWPRMVAVWNWINVAQQVLWIAAALPGLLHAGEFVMELAGLITLGWAVWLEWFSLRLVLSLGGLAVAGIVALDVLVGLLVDIAVTVLTG